MNRLGHQSKTVEQQLATPHMVRRAIRYRAADNARAAIRKQFPELFVPQQAQAKGPEHRA